MLRVSLLTLLAAGWASGAAAQPLPIAPAYPAPAPDMAPAPTPVVPAQYAYRERPNLGGGFIEFLFGDRGAPPRYVPAMPQPLQRPTPPANVAYASPQPQTASRPNIDARFLPQVVHYTGPEKPGTVIIDTPQRFLFLVQEGGTAIRYGIGVGRPGFEWAGVKHVTAKREWPDWRPPDEMLERQPDLPRFMPGGPNNPLGARALYLGSSLYRIHGSNEPWTIGHAVSSGCIRMRNEDVIDLYERVPVGAKVVVI
jgi:lipoprotein-anchoring transpeptidase ErfK/SrfK